MLEGNTNTQTKKLHKFMNFFFLGGGWVGVGTFGQQNGLPGIAGVPEAKYPKVLEVEQGGGEGATEQATAYLG